MKKYLYVLFVILLIIGCRTEKTAIEPVKTGADLLLEENVSLIRGKNVAIVTNHTGCLSNGVHLIDTLDRLPDVTISALFGPEHGIRGDAPDGLKIRDGIDDQTGAPIYSLYGKTLKPTKKMLEGSDVIIFDIQDVGARFYTFISTMYYIMEAGAEYNIPVIILDRPNPIGGVKFDGPLRDEELKSFVAIAPVALMHGLTVGELATIFNEEGMLEGGIKGELHVIKMKNWNRAYYYDQCGLKWIDPSPNMPSVETAIVYPGMCFIEGTNISEGRGTKTPFLVFGAPYVNNEELTFQLNGLKLPGIKFHKTEYIPVEIEGMASNPKFQGEKCFGCRLEITSREKFQPVKTGIYIISKVHELYPDDFSFRGKRLDKLFGKEYFRIMVSDNSKPEEIIKKWKKDTNEFSALRKKYLLY